MENDGYIFIPRKETLEKLPKENVSYDRKVFSKDRAQRKEKDAFLWNSEGRLGGKFYWDVDKNYDT